MSHLVTPLIGGLTLVVGFAAAMASRSQVMGGVVLIAGALWCVARERGRTPGWRIAVVVAVAAVGFAASHRVAAIVGPWPAVLLAAALTTTAAAVLLTRTRR